MIDDKLKKCVDNVVWWIPFKKTRDSLRNILYELLDLESKFEKENFISTKPIMTDKERNLFINSISNSKYYLEFGAGGSTFLVLKTTNAKVFSVEGDNNWIDNMRRNYFIYEQELLGKLTFYYMDIGKIRYSSYPIDDSKRDYYPNYSSKIFEYLNIDTINKIDTILIDGRFRVACALNTILNVNKDANIIIHDFFNRDYYHILLKYLDCINKVDTLGVFKIKDNIDKNDIIKLLEEYKYDLR